MKSPQLKLDIGKGRPAVFRQRQLTDESPFPFGKWKGAPMKNVPSPYLDWFIGQPWANSWPAVVAYIARCRKSIDQDLKHAERSSAPQSDILHDATVRPSGFMRLDKSHTSPESY